jgi:hypothetical protein
MRTAAEALRAAAADAGIEHAMPERGEGNLSDGDCGGRGFGAPMLAEAIAALSEDDQETLGDYIEAYEDAVAALEAARAEAEEGDDLSSYDEAVRTAAEALRAAAADAGIELAMPVPGGKA